MCIYYLAARGCPPRGDEGWSGAGFSLSRVMDALAQATLSGKMLGKRTKKKEKLRLGRFPHSMHHALLGLCVCEPWIQKALWASPGASKKPWVGISVGSQARPCPLRGAAQSSCLQQVPELPRGPGQSAGK